jgi:hypothetical protein
LKSRSAAGFCRTKLCYLSVEEREPLSVKRREFITLLVGVTSWPLAARAQQTAKPPTIGYLGATTPSAESQRVAALVQRLRELGWIESRNLTIEYRYAEGRSERYTELAAEFVRLNVDVIVTYGTPAVAATKQATAMIPIVFAVAGDPIGSGLVASLPRPGGNVTGLSLQKTDVADKRLDLLREVVPGLRGLAVMANAASPVSVLEMREVESTARKLGHEVATFEIRRAEDIVPTFGDGAQIEGSVIAQDVTVCGRVKGTIRAVRVKLQNGGAVEGDIFHRSLSIDENSLFEGSSRRVENPTEAPSVDAKGPQEEDLQSSALAPYLHRVEASASTDWSESTAEPKH